MVRRLAVTISPIVPLPRVAPRDEHAILVRETHRGAIDLELRAVPRRAHSSPAARDRAHFPIAQLVIVERVAERDHWHHVNDAW